MFSRLLAGSTIALSLGNALAAGVAWGGVNIAGFDFGCTTDGNCDLGKVVPPEDALAQMKHFVNDDKLNAFRLPVGWQYLVNNQLGGTLDAGNLAKYDDLMQSCLSTGAYCIIDIHNYARWNGQIIGQGGPSDDEFASLWSQLATKYAAESKVVMGIVNEPHDMPDITRWATTVQAVVTSIRKAGATTQQILLPGNGYTNAAQFPTGSGPALSKVTNPDGSTTNLIFDVHQYLDSDNSGTHINCVKNQIDGAFAPLATWLRANKRQALLSEFGGSSDASCLKNVCEALDFLNKNPDVYLGYLGWGAGAFSPDTYVLSLTPMPGNVDQPVMKQCFAAKFSGGGGAAPTPAPGPSSYPASSSPASSAAPNSTTSAPSASTSAYGSTSASPESTNSTTQKAPATTYSSPAAAPPTGYPPQPKMPISSDVLPPGRSSSTDAAPYPTGAGYQPSGSLYGSSAPTTFSTAVKSTGTTKASPEETGSGEPDDDTCEA